MPFAMTWMNLEIVTLSEVREIKYHMVSHMQNPPKNGTNEVVYKTEIVTGVENSLMVTREEMKVRDELRDWG